MLKKTDKGVVLDLTDYKRGLPDRRHSKLRNDKGVLPFEWMEDIEARDTEWLVNGMIPTTGNGLLVGKWGQGKTYIALDLGLSAARGKDFAGRKTKRCGVLYFAVDRPRQATRRARFMMRHFKVGRNLPLVQIDRCPRLLKGSEASDDAIEALIKTAHAVADEMKQIGVRLGLIFFDTMIVAAGYKNESDSVQAQEVNQILRTLSEETGTFVLGIDHAGHGAVRARGSSDKEDSADYLFTVNQGVLTLTKLTDGAGQGDKIKFELVKHDDGEDRDGNAKTECTVRWDGEIPQDDDRDAVLTALLHLGAGSLASIAKRAGFAEGSAGKSRVDREIKKMTDLVKHSSRGFVLTDAGRQMARIVATDDDDED